jgi:hypothetical protein
MTDLSSLSGCVGFYGHPEPGLRCEACEHQVICRAVIRRDQLRPKLLKVESALRGLREVVKRCDSTI